MAIGNKLCIIEFDSKDKVRGNYEVMLSGSVKHIPNHKYLVSEKQIQVLKEKGLKYHIIEC